MGRLVGLTRRQQDVLTELRFWGPMTDVQLVEKIRDQPPSGVRTRRSELVAMGLVEDSGDRVAGSTGRFMVVWRACDHPAPRAEQLSAFDL